MATDANAEKTNPTKKCKVKKFKTYAERREEAAAKARARREANIPDPWCQRKLAVFIAIICIAYGSTGFIGWVCVPMIRSDPHRRGPRTRGICLLVFFLLLLAMVIWSYLRVLFTKPGLAKDYAPKVPCPPLESTFQPDAGDTAALAEEQQEAAPPPAGAPVSTPSNQISEPQHDGHDQGVSHDQQPPDGLVLEKTRRGIPVPRRQPHRTPVLQPYFRWCSRCELVKPPRAHHCRHCGTCVLKMDHHCPWLGGCCGARNYKYFFNFCFWAALFCLYIFLGTLTALIPIYNPPQGYHLEPQQIAVLAISFVFGVFTWGMVFSHIRLIALNLTTIEDMMFSRVSDHEATELDYAFGWYDLKGKSRTRKRWVEEFGRLRREGNPWWLGSLSRNWRMVFGDAWWAWFIPVQARPHHDDGLHYELNSRFTKDGIQLPRSMWPKELQ